MRRPTAIVLLALAVALVASLSGSLSRARAQDGGSPVAHSVQAGDNLYRIALRYGVTMEALLAANGLTTTSVIVPGQTLTIPAAAAAIHAPAVTVPAGARTHRVSEGESLLQIARRYNVTLDALVRANAITSETVIVPGQVLIIPSEGGTADLGLVGVSVPAPPARPPAADLGILPAGASPVPAAQHAPLPPPTQAAPASAALVEAAPTVVSGTFDDTLVAPDLGILAPPPAAEPVEEPVAAPAEDAALTPLEEVASAPEQPEAAPAEPAESAALASGADDETLGIVEQPEAALFAVVGETLNPPDLGIIAPDTAAWVRQPGLFTTGGARVREVFERGQALGNNPHAFSKVGDCNSELPFFLGRFDSGDYELGPYAYLQPAIDHFGGSFGRQSMAVWTGSHAWSVLDPIWARPALCLPGESPLGCEFRLHRPSVVLIRLGTNEAHSPALFEQHMRAIIEYAMAQGVIPVLGTKADQLEGSDRINDIVRQLAAEYEMPLWDFGRVAGTVPGRGLRQDGFHMTWYPLTYGDPRALQAGHSVHNLTALIALNTVWQSAMVGAG
jgi:LysM repeat protein